MRRLACTFGLVLTLAACSTSGSGSGAQTGGAADAPARGAADRAAGGLTDVTSLGRAQIRTGTMTVHVADVAAAARAAVRTAEEAGGFLESERTDSGGTVLTVRVPPDEFTATSDALGRLGSVADRTVATEDVTGDVADVEGRLKAARASTERVRGLLQRATTIAEITSLESELNEREAALESLETRRRVLAGKTAFAALTATFARPPAAVAAAPTVDDASFTGGLRAGWRVFRVALAVTLAVVGALLPFAVVALLVGIPAYLLHRRRVTARA